MCLFHMIGVTMYTVEFCLHIEDNGVQDETTCLGAEFVLGCEGN
jgi:hypothetical protein